MFCCLTASTARALLCMANAQGLRAGLLLVGNLIFLRVLVSSYFALLFLLSPLFRLLLLLVLGLVLVSFDIAFPIVLLLCCFIVVVVVIFFFFPSFSLFVAFNHKLTGILYLKLVAICWSISPSPPSKSPFSVTDDFN